MMDTNLPVSEAPVSVSSSVETPSSAASYEAPQEKVLRQSDVDKIVGRVKNESYERGRNDGKAEYSQPAAQAPVQQPYQAPAAPVNPADIRKMIAEQTQQMHAEGQLQHLANTFVTKLEEGRSKYDDFESITTPLNLPQIPEIWQTAAGFENPADIIYELGKNPAKLAALRNIAYSPELVKREMAKISDSLKQNAEASEVKQPNAPLVRHKPSNISLGNGKKSEDMTTADWKSVFRG